MTIFICSDTGNVWEYQMGNQKLYTIQWPTQTPLKKGVKSGTKGTSDNPFICP